jgi:peptide/nickel transport system permease protein
VALESDYTRTAFLKGLSPAAVLFRHVLRNGLMSTVAVISSQIGYIFGGLVVIEVIFNYDGIGRLIYVAANQKDFAVLQTGIIIVGSIYFLVSILGDIVQSALDPRTRFKR